MEVGPAGGAAPPCRLRVLYTNDMHGCVSPVQDQVVLGGQAELGGSTYLATLVAQAREQEPGRTLLLDSGDAVHGSLTTDLDQGLSMAEVMGKVGYDAATLGNHDFQWGVPSLIGRLEQTPFPVVVANVVQEDGSPLPHTRPHQIFERDGVKVGIVGLLTTETAEAQRSDRVEGVRFLDEGDSLRASLKALRREGAEVVLVLSHMGVEKDRQVAGRFPGEGLVFLGGHSHDRLPVPLEVEGNYIVQAGSRGRELGEVTLDLDLHRRTLASVSHRLIPVDPSTVEPDPEVAALVARYEDRAKEEMGKPFALLTRRLTRCDHADSPLGNLVTDAMRRTTGTKLAFMNSAGLRTDLEAGPITMGQLYGLMPFGGEVMQGVLTGAQILEALESSVEHRATEPGVQSQFLQVSGLRYAYDASRPPGERILKAEVGDKPLDPKTKYSVALEDYLAEGRLGYTSFRDGHWRPTGTPVLTAIREGLSARSQRLTMNQEPPRIDDRTPPHWDSSQAR